MLISKIITIFVIVNIFTLLQAGTIVVTSTSDSGPGSFRQALLDATSGDEIYFDTAVFPSANPAIIYLTSALPSINQGNLIIMGGEISEELNIVDAGVIIDGSGLSGSEDGLYIDSDRNRIWSLEIRGFYNGISIAPGKSDNIIGGGWDSWGNYIYNNKNNGISVGEGGMNNNIAENIIFGNGHMRIDLGDDGPTFNDAMDADTGTNKLQNFPIITSAVLDEGIVDMIKIEFFVDSNPANSAYPLSVAFYSASNSHPLIKFFSIGSFSFTESDYNNGTATVYMGPISELGYAVGDTIISTATDLQGNTSEYSSEVIISAPTSIGDPKLPLKTMLYENFPNPFNPSTHISFTISKAEHVKLEVLNTIGQKLKILVNKKLGAGHHTIQFDATNLSSGVYFYRIEAGGIQDVKKMILLR